jgi:flagellar hook-length control protein FliK
MKIGGPEKPQQADYQQQADTPSPTSSRFQSLLEEKRRKYPAREDSTSQEDPPPAPPPVLLPNQPDFKPESTSTAHAPNLPIPDIAAQIVSQLRSVHTVDSSQSVAIQFRSPVLGGLNVTLKAHQNQLAIHIAAASEPAAALLRDHADDLKSLLAKKGFQVTDVVVSGSARTPQQQRGSGSR